MKISVVTINLNNLAGLKKTYESLTSQTYQNWEWVVIDGGSTMGDKEFLEAHTGEIAYWCSEKDKGVYNAQNKSLSHTTGDYIIFMNSGDTFYDAEVMTHIFSKAYTDDVIYGDWVQVWEDGHYMDVSSPKKVSLFQLCCLSNLCHQSMFIKREKILSSPYDESYRIYADWAKWIDWVKRGCTFRYVPYKICYFEMGGISGTKQLMEEEKTRLERDVFPPAMGEASKFIARLQYDLQQLRHDLQQEMTRAYESEKKLVEMGSMHPLSLEADRYIKEKQIYRKIIHTAIRLIHLLKKSPKN